MRFVCQTCGGSEFSHYRDTDHPVLLLLCSGCRSEARVEGAAIESEDGYVMESDALPESLAAVGNDEEDPWIWFRARMKCSQRELLHDAIALVSTMVGRPVHASTSIEYMAAEFISTYRRPGAKSAGKASREQGDG